MKLGLIGAGNMASALAVGIGEPVLVADVDRAKAEQLAAATGGEALASNAEVAEGADVVLLCHKPWQLGEVAAEVAPKARAVASVLGAVRTGELEEAYPGLPVYRFIPNMPVEVRRGVLGYAAGKLASDGPEQELLELFGRVGLVVPLDEPLLEPAMAIMSCGPAFVALVAEAFADAGTAHGIDAGDAARMTVETLAGTAAWLEAHDLDMAGLQARVATPGGVTEKGLDTMKAKGVPEACHATVDTVVEATAR